MNLNLGCFKFLILSNGCVCCLLHLRIRNPKAIYAHTHQHALFDSPPCRLPLSAPLSDPHPLGPPHGSEPVAACPPRAFCPTAAGPQPAAARHDHPSAHHGHFHHHGNHLIAGHGQSGRPQFHQCGQVSLVRGKVMRQAAQSLAGLRLVSC